ncbi:MAG TPA: F0F1 ATP synthase subunit delta [Candidatus Saccharibacteria bacterium]|nr:F0F1 ATP synthase subunit delta [Candidatus Saccharibacteria bacterium]HRK94202.1 F0F1 ATP synthase subunit delta [Candidatus Saccharibacteria bacterium]
MAMVSRRKLANLAARRIAGGEVKASVLRDLAAYLIDSGRQREAELLVRDVETAMLKHGIAVGTVVSARKLSTDALATVEGFVKHHYKTVTKVVLRERLDSSVIGGVRLELPDKQLDATIQTRLDKLTV